MKLLMSQKLNAPNEKKELTLDNFYVVKSPKTILLHIIQVTFTWQFVVCRP